MLPGSVYFGMKRLEMISVKKFSSMILLNVTRFGIMSRKSPKVELRYWPRKSE